LQETIKVVIGTPVSREHAYILDQFLKNQVQIQQAYPHCKLVLATSEKDYAQKLKDMLDTSQLKGTVLTHDIIKPDYARHWIWDVTSGRETIRQYTISQTDANHLLFLDADMLCEPDIVTTMMKYIDGGDTVFNGYALRGHGIGLAGAGCLMLNRRVLERISFRCREFKNGEVIFEDNLLEIDLFRLHARVKKGIYVATDHYQDADSFKHLEPYSIGIVRRLANHPFIRYILIKSSMAVHYNIPWRLKGFLEKLGGG